MLKAKGLCRACGRTLTPTAGWESWDNVNATEVAKAKAELHLLCDRCSRLLIHEHFTSKKIVRVMVGLTGN